MGTLLAEVGPKVKFCSDIKSTKPPVGVVCGRAGESVKVIKVGEFIMRPSQANKAVKKEIKRIKVRQMFLKLSVKALRFTAVVITRF